MKKTNYLNIIYLLLAISFGFIIGKSYNFKFFELSKSIDIVELASLIATIFVALLITSVIEKNKQDFRTEKDLLINKIKDIDDMLEKLNFNLNSTEYLYSEAASSLKRIRMGFTTIFSLLEKTKIVINSNMNNEINVQLSELKDLITNTPIIGDEELGKANLPIEVKNNILKLSKKHYSIIETKLSKIQNQCIDLQFEINKG